MYCSILKCWNESNRDSNYCKLHQFLEDGYLQSIVDCGINLNYDWVRVNPNHSLSKEMSNNYDQGEGVETCCEITANAVAKRFGIFSWERTLLKFSDALKLEVPLRIEMGFFHDGFIDQVDNPNHVVMVFNDCMIDSFFQERAITFFPLDSKLIHAFETFDFETIFALSDCSPNEFLGFEMHIFVPNVKIILK